MPPIVQVKITGGAELFEALERAPAGIAKKIIREGLKAAAGLWREEMVNRVARGWHHWKLDAKVARSHGVLANTTSIWGFLSEHVGMETVVRGDELEGSCQVGPVRAGFWDLFLEFGTAHMPAQPFIRQSYEARKDDVLAKFVRVCQEMLGEMGLR